MIERRLQAGSPSTPARARAVPPTIRAGSVSLMAATGAGAGLILAGRPLAETRAALADDATSWEGLPLEVLLSWACAAALAVCCLWLLTITVATALEAATGVSSAALRAITPHVVHRGVLLACGVAVGSTAVVGPASATTEAGPGAGLGHTAAAVLELDGLPLPDRPTGGLRHAGDPAPRPTPSGRDATQAGPGSSPTARATDSSVPASARFRVATATTADVLPRARYQVRSGDSLWSIARRIRPDGDLAEVDRTWRRVYRANRRDIGADPDLLIPGTTLQLPVRPSGARRLDGPSGPGPLPHRKDAS